MLFEKVKQLTEANYQVVFKAVGMQMKIWVIKTSDEFKYQMEKVVPASEEIMCRVIDEMIREVEKKIKEMA